MRLVKRKGVVGEMKKKSVTTRKRKNDDVIEHEVENKLVKKKVRVMQRTAVQRVSHRYDGFLNVNPGELRSRFVEEDT